MTTPDMGKAIGALAKSAGIAGSKLAPSQACPNGPPIPTKTRKQHIHVSLAINDQHGHLEGNRALCRLGQILADCSRSVDTAARHGGDEFAVVLPETGMAAATLVARRICDVLAKDTEDPALSVSVGIVCYPRDGDSIATLCSGQGSLRDEIRKAMLCSEGSRLIFTRTDSKFEVSPKPVTEGTDE